MRKAEREDYLPDFLTPTVCFFFLFSYKLTFLMIFSDKKALVKHAEEDDMNKAQNSVSIILMAKFIIKTHK